MGGKIDPEIAPTASNAAEVTSQYESDLKKPVIEDNAHFTAAELEKYGQTYRGLSPRHVQLMAIGGMPFLFPSSTNPPSSLRMQILTKRSQVPLVQASSSVSAAPSPKPVLYRSSLDTSSGAHCSSGLHTCASRRCARTCLSAVPSSNSRHDSWIPRSVSPWDGRISSPA